MGTGLTGKRIAIGSSRNFQKNKSKNNINNFRISSKNQSKNSKRF